MKNFQRKVFGTLEWATKNENIILGCSHDCKYCYSKEMAIRFKRATPANWKKEKLNKKNISRKIKKVEGRIMFPSSHDITPKNLKYSLPFIDNLLNAGNELLIVSKPHLFCIKEICNNVQQYKNKLLFRFTIGSPNTKVLEFWEPKAPSFAERMSALKFACNKNYQTSISIEPILDNIKNIEDLVIKILPYVTDAIWIGKPNFLKRRLQTNKANGKETMNKLEQLEEWCNNENIYKLYNKLKTNKKIKWKESIKKVVGLDIPTTKGLDI